MSSGITQRRRHNVEETPVEPAPGPSAFVPEDYDEDDVKGNKGKDLTLMEEILLLGLKDSEVFGKLCSLTLELSFRGRINVVKDPRKPPFHERMIQVIDERLTGEVLLDETLRYIKTDTDSIANWIDLLSVRERIAKGLVDKGVLRTEKKSFVLFDVPTHPVSNPKVKEALIQRIVDCLLGRGAAPNRRTIACVCAAYAANVLENAFVGLSHAQREQAFLKVDEYLKQHADLTEKSKSIGTTESGLSATRIFQENATEERAENARLASFVGAIAVGDLVKSTLGPKGMDKILQSLSDNKNVMVTNDGATILKSIALDNAAAKVLVQDDEVGDGTTSVCVLAAELLREGERLVNQKVHPQTIIDGYRIASATAFKALEASALDNSKNKELFRKDLINIAKTTLSSKVLSQDKEYFATLAVDAVLRLKGSTNLDHIQIIKKNGGKLTDSYLDEAMDTDKIKIFGARVRVDATGKLADLERAEKDKMRAKVEKIKDHGINCFVNRQLIYNYPEQLFADSGVTAIEHADFDGVERLALVTGKKNFVGNPVGGEICSTFDHPELVKLGHCDLIEEIIIGEDKLIKFSGVAAGEACTIVLRGATNQLLDEAERSLHDALCVLSQSIEEPRTVLGGGCSEMLMAKAVDEIAVTTPGKQALAIESFARALRQLPTILADNAGYDSSDLVARLRAAHASGKSTFGLDMYNGDIADVSTLGITESFKLKRQVLLSASEATEMILRVDDIIRCAPREHYTWMFGDSTLTYKSNLQILSQFLPKAKDGFNLAIDLGCGTGFQTIPLLQLDYNVIAIDSSPQLIDELQIVAKSRNLIDKLNTIEGDLVNFPTLKDEVTPDSPNVIICMGDTLTHLDSLETIEGLFRKTFSTLHENGIFLLQFRDLSRPLVDTDRFIPIRSDERTVFTCFLEWENNATEEDGTGCTIKVNDLIHVKKGIGAWELCTSWYHKLAVSQSWCLNLLKSIGFHIVESDNNNGMIFIVASKREQ
ncbi:T-complex protein 1 subunit beta [Globomyces sp. JEL0801]|nr:T-complex protein 1 subunit beta [Globomyces sp. JEL0801]